MKKAKVITKNGSMTPNGRERVMSLRMGEKGKGKMLGSVKYWPWSGISCDQADHIIQEIGERCGVKIIW